MNRNNIESYLDRLLKTYGDLGGELHQVEFDRESAGLGVSLAGNRDLGQMSIFVVGIQPGSPVAIDGRIHVGDELLEINGQTLYGRSHLNASAIIKGVTSRRVKIILLRRPDFDKHMAVKPLKLPPVKYKDDPSTLIPKKQKLDENSINSEAETNGAVPCNDETNSTNDIISQFPKARTITLTKGGKGLGFAIQEGNEEDKKGIYVKSITPGGVAHQNGQITLWDRLLSVNGESLVEASYEKALEKLRKTPQGPVNIMVLGPSENKTTVSDNVEVVVAAETIKEHEKMETVAPEDVMVVEETRLEETPDRQKEEKMEKEVREEKKVEEAPPPPQAPAVVPVIKEPPPEVLDPATCPITPGREVHIEIQKGKSGLGLSIVGGSDTMLGLIVIHEVYEEGAAARDGRLWAGDQILEVNHENLREATHDRAIQVLRQTPSVVDMVVYRDEVQVRDEDMYDTFTVELVKKPNKGLGISIVGRRNDGGIFISDVVKGGVAESDGRLLQGDQILEVNAEDMRTATQETAAAKLKTIMGKIVLLVGRLKGSRSSSRRSSSTSQGMKKSDSGLGGKKAKHRDWSDESGQEVMRIVELEKDVSGSLGLSIAGGLGSPLGDMPIIIAQVNPNGPAASSGVLKEGDQILSLNGESLDNVTHDEAVAILRAATGQIILEVIQVGQLMFRLSFLREVQRVWASP